MIKIYRKKPVCIEALQYTGSNEHEISDFVGSSFEKTVTQLGIQTLEGFMNISVGDFIIKGVNGEFYPCKPDIFEKTYEYVKSKLNTLSEDVKRESIVLKNLKKRAVVET